MNLKYTLGTAVLTLVVGMSGAAAARGQAQIRVDRDGVQFGPSLDPRQHGYEHAYREGADRGRYDRDHKGRYNLNSRAFRDTANGWEPFMGDRGRYQAGYRDGYRAGYDSAFRGDAGRYGQVYGRNEENRNRWDHPSDPYASRNWGSSDLAFDTGYRDGVTAGEYDYRRQARSDFRATDAYRNGNNGFGAGYGESNAYQEHYRTGFERGYLDGYGRSR